MTLYDRLKELTSGDTTITSREFHDPILMEAIIVYHQQLGANMDELVPAKAAFYEGMQGINPRIIGAEFCVMATQTGEIEGIRFFVITRPTLSTLRTLYLPVKILQANDPVRMAKLCALQVELERRVRKVADCKFELGRAEAELNIMRERLGIKTTESIT